MRTWLAVGVLQDPQGRSRDYEHLVEASSAQEAARLTKRHASAMIRREFEPGAKLKLRHATITPWTKKQQKRRERLIASGRHSEENPRMGPLPINTSLARTVKSLQGLHEQVEWTGSVVNAVARALAMATDWNGLTLMEIAGDALEDANFHPEAAAVRQLLKESSEDENPRLPHGRYARQAHQREVLKAAKAGGRLEIHRVPSREESYAPSWKCEALAEEEWVSNALRFATRQEAIDYGMDLMSRWMAAKQTREVQTGDPVTHRFVSGKLIATKQPEAEDRTWTNPPSWIDEEKP